MIVKLITWNLYLFHWIYFFHYTSRRNFYFDAGNNSIYINHTHKHAPALAHNGWHCNALFGFHCLGGNIGTALMPLLKLTLCMQLYIKCNETSYHPIIMQN